MYSNRPSKRPDPTVAPITYDRVTGIYKTRPPFQPSRYLEEREERRQAARERNRG